MGVRRTQAMRLLIALATILSLSPGVRAWEPNKTDLDAAVSAGDSAAYFANISAWLEKEVPADPNRISADALSALLQDPVFVNALDQRQLLAKIGVAKVDAFARSAPGNRAFLSWLMQDTQAMDLLLEGATPSGADNRAANKWTIPVSSLDIWNRVRQADPEARTGLYQRLAIATALAPPGSGNRGAGMAKTPADPVDRYKHFKTANENGELFSPFSHLTVWEYKQVVSSSASDQDLAWAREMVNTWRPDLRANQQVVLTTSQVQYRNSPTPYTDFASVIAGGGKCGPRSSWAVMICQAFGIPAIGVGQPGHACVAYKAADPSQQPQPGNVWKVAYGRGWPVSKLEGIQGPEFLEDVAARSRVAEFSQVEHMRWLAATLTSKEQAAAVMSVAKAISHSTTTMTSAPATTEGSAEPIAGLATRAGPATRPDPPDVTTPGAIHVEAASFFEQGGVHCYRGQADGVQVMDCYTGGKQLHFQASMATAWVGYRIEVPATGTYQLTARVAAVNSGQALYVRSFGAMLPVKKATASVVFRNMVKELGPQQAVDNNPGTRWAVNENNDQCWLELDLGGPKTISTVMIDERAWNRVSKFRVEFKEGDDWKTILAGTNIGIDFARDFAPVTARHVRLNILDAREVAPTIWEFSVGTVKDGCAWIGLPCTKGLWEVTEPVDISLVKGSQTIWIFAPFQRGVSLKWFELKPKSDQR